MSRSGNLRQVELRDETGAALVCWLANEKRIRIGVRLTLKETGDRIWVVNALYHELRKSSDLDFNRGWKVGGLV